MQRGWAAPGVDRRTALRWTLRDLARAPRFARLAPGLRRIARGETFAHLLRERAEQDPDRARLLFPDCAWTFAQLDAEANRVAQVLRSAGACQGDVVAIMAPNSPELLAAQAAVAKLGAVGALINTHLSGAPLARALGASGARELIVDPDCLARVRQLGLPDLRLWSWGAEPLAGAGHLEEAKADAASTALPAVATRARDVFLYIYSSGTTGVPKPARITYFTHAAGGLFFSKLLGVGSADAVYAPLPLYHGQSNIVGFGLALRTGAAFVSRRQFSASAFWDDVRRHDVTTFVYVGELARYLLAQPARPDDTTHRARLAVGAGMRPDVWTRFRQRFGVERIVELYGETEGNISLQNLDGIPGSVGKPPPFEWRNLALARYDVERGELVRGPDGRLVPCGFGEPGLLLGRLGGGMRADAGYVHAADMAERTLTDAFAPGDRWYRSSDLLRRDRSGNYYFVDRVGDTFRWKGENVSTQEVAETLTGFPDVIEAVVYGVHVPGADGQAGMAALVIEPGSELDPSAFHRFVAERLPAYARPLFVRLTAQIQTTGTLKQRKVNLRVDGYDLGRVRDPVYVRDDGAGTYRPLTEDLTRQVTVNVGRL